MSFLYPLFLAAGITVAIPILIHLFNLRRYKTVFFPNTRFLKNIQLHSQKQSRIRYKLLLTARILFLLLLILAFAQPFLDNKKKKDVSNRLQVIYIDNSSSMSLKKGARNLLEMEKEAVRKQVDQAAAGTKFLLLTNDKPTSYQPVPAAKIIAELNDIGISPVTRTAGQVFSTVQGLIQSEAIPAADIFYYSDFQRNSFPAQTEKGQLENLGFYGVPIRTETVRNIYIDTAFLSSPVLQTGQGNKIIVKTRLVGKAPEETPVLQLAVNGQVKSAASPNLKENGESIDTLSFQVNGPGWQQIELTVNDASVRFDDSFRITARSASNLSVLVLNEGQPNPYIQAGFRTNTEFRVNQLSINQSPADWNDYNLVILNGVTRMDDVLTKQIAQALQKGQSITIFPGRSSNYSALNEALMKISAIRITGLDTASETATSLQQGSELVKDLFERIPENVQLPTATWHYNISAGLSANQQSILSFRNGDPFLAQYNPGRGKLYLMATSADLTAGNFPGSYFFAPFLYQMTAQSKGGDVYAVTAGKEAPVYIPLKNADERNMIHVYGAGVDVIPPQRPAGSGLDVYLHPSVQQPGFYMLAARGADSIAVPLNLDRQESQLELWNMDKLKEQWSGKDIHWAAVNAAAPGAETSGSGSFPLWKVCVILALIMLAAETFLLAGNFRKQTVAAQ